MKRLEGDLERGFSGHGPHRDELAILRDGRELRVYGSQGEQRLALLALLLAERAVLAQERRRTPLMLLDDVMSELDAERRDLLARELSAGGQSVIATNRPRPRPRRRGRVGHAHADLAGGDPAGGDRRVRRAAPRPISAAISDLSATLAPTTTLARVQAIWVQTAGPAIAEARPPDGRAQRDPDRHLRRRRVGAGARPDGLRADPAAERGAR